MVRTLEIAIKAAYRCYAGILHLRHGKDDTQPDKRTNSGYAKKFEVPELFPGRMAGAAAWNDLTGTARVDKPWMNGLPRMIFISDMADSLSSNIPFEYLKSEIIDVVGTEKAQQHVWLWLTKRPARMAEFSEWLAKLGLHWPDNLMAMTSVTSQKTVGRIAQLGKVRCKHRGLSVEPLWSSVTLPLDGMAWCIVGGESGSYAQPFHLDWARDVVRQCRRAGVAPFVKQLGAAPMDGGTSLFLADSHGGDWSEWPEDLRVREFPPVHLLKSGTLNPEW